ncbi:sulfurtransferase [Halorarum halophilum]|uniref:Sulfurtransferase n=1 Tax=Halorarum halophilum TaxID=2743090 RepID=A0A7D5K8K1_9EURY|nr:rhodanese-like domain-containing protein [Halobaculum halophilum]QLG28254.1 sulfurtransferase [Halobaculum halophilum]
MDTFVSAERLAYRLDDVRVVDVRDGWEYEGIGHLPGAVSIPFAEFRSRDGDAGMLPGADRWADLLSSAGIDADDEVVAYDDTHGVFAARFLVTAELYGHDTGKLHLLDGDYSAWSREHEVTTDVPDPEPTEYEPHESDESPLVTFEEVEAALADDGIVLVDTREAWEYEEGHLPGAVQLDWMELVDADSRGLKPRDELQSVLADRGIAPDRRVLLYCNTARRISHTYLVLRHLGYGNLAFYEGSLTEWEERGGAMETGA